MKKEELFTLVKSLSRSEKRYFKIFASQTGGASNYVRLFEAMDAQTDFDEAAIRQKFAGERFLKQLHVTKNYLRQLILKSLRNFHHAISKNAELKDILRNVEILFQKELYAQCETEIRRAERMAGEYELVVGELEISAWKRKLEQARHPQNYTGLNVIIEGQEAALEKLRNTHRYWRLAIGMSGGMFGRMPKLEGEPALLSDAGNALTMEAKVLHFNTLYLYHLRSGRQKKSVEALQKLIEYLEQFPKRAREDSGLYLSTVNNLVSFHTFNQSHEKGLELLRRGRAFTGRFPLKSEKRSLLKQVFRGYNIELEIYRTTGAFEENALFISEMENFVDENRFKMPLDYCLSFWFQLAYIAFMRKDFDRSLHWLNLLLNTRQNIRPDLQIHARFLNLMVHLEQRNFFVLNYFVASTRRFLKKQKEVKPHEKTLLQFFSKMGRLPEYEWKGAFRELDEKLYPAGKESLVPEMEAGYIDFRKWLLESGK